MPVDTELVAIENPDGLNVILGQTHFIKTAEDLHEALVGAVPGIHFGLAFCEASGPCLVRVEGNAEDLKAPAAKNALAIGAGHFFIVFLRDAYPINVLRAVRQLADTGRNYRDFGCPQPNPKAGHPDGWGIACLGADGEFYARSAAKATADPKYEEAVKRLVRVCSPPLSLLVHLRYASKRDTIQEQYAHPFRREVDGRVTFFAHNGEIEGFGLQDGKIDTQLIYDRFLDSLGTEARPLPEFKQAVAKAKAAIDAEFPRKVESYTFLMLDGGRLIAHRDARTCVPYYTLHETSTGDMRVVCSEVLPTLPGRWRMLRNGEFFEVPG